MANEDEGFLREVEEELRRERLEKLWKEYGTYLLAGALLIVLGVLGYKYLEHRRVVAAQTAGARYEGALTLAQEGKEGSATKEFEIIASEGPEGYRALAKIQFAGALLKQGKKDAALAAYDALAKDASADQMLRDFAALQAAAVQVGDADFTEMENRLKPLMGDDNAWRYSARELLGLAAFKAGKSEQSRDILTPLLVDPKVPQTIVARAKIILAEITAADLAKKAGSEPPSPASAASAADNTSASEASSGAKKE